MRNATRKTAVLTILILCPLMFSGCKILRKHGCHGGHCGGPVCGDAGCGDIINPSPHAFKQWKGDCGPCQGPKWCICKGHGHGACGEPACACEPGCECEPECACEPGCECEPACECEPGCECEPSCVVEPGCGCNDACGCGSACGPHGSCRFIYSLKYAWRKAVGGVFGCNGCSGELYWSEWHNDPPVCCDPCDNCGNWIGPSAGSYRAPYDHEYSATTPEVVTPAPESIPAPGGSGSR